VVYYILKGALEAEETAKDCHVYSAFCRPCARGFVYVEAMSPLEAALICRRSVFYRGGITVVSLEDAVALLGCPLPCLRPEHRWVRIKRGVYAGDLAYLLSSLQETVFRKSNPKACIWIIPRMPEEDDPSEKSLKRKHSNIGTDVLRPPAKKFDPAAVKQRHGLRRISDSKWKFGDKVFINGFLELEIPHLSLNFVDATPTRSELQTWAALDNEHMDDSLSDYIKQSLLDLCADFWPGDRIKVVGSNHRGAYGKVKKVTDEGVLVLLDSAEEHLAHRSDICKFFEPGNFVQIISGPYEGSSGWVVHIEPSEVTQAFVSESGTNQEVSPLPTTAASSIHSLFSWHAQ
jgi:transcription elongation factor SPT5